MLFTMELLIFVYPFSSLSLLSICLLCNTRTIDIQSDMLQQLSQEDILPCNVSRSSTLQHIIIHWHFHQCISWSTWWRKMYHFMMLFWIFCPYTLQAYYMVQSVTVSGTWSCLMYLIIWTPGILQSYSSILHFFLHILGVVQRQDAVRLLCSFSIPFQLQCFCACELWGIWLTVYM